jgi:hypothetical protein
MPKFLRDLPLRLARETTRSAVLRTGALHDAQTVWSDGTGMRALALGTEALNFAAPDAAGL